MKKFATFATAAVVASTIVPVFAVADSNDTPNVTQVVVDQSGVTMSSATSFDFDSAAPGVANVTSNYVGYSVLTNNAAGYQIDLSLTDLTKTGVRAVLDDGSQTGNDRIDNENIWALDGEVLTSAVAINDVTTHEAAFYNPAEGAFADGDAAKVADSLIRSRNDEDTFRMKLRFDMPWIETGSYAGSATFTATNL